MRGIEGEVKGGEIVFLHRHRCCIAQRYYTHTHWGIGIIEYNDYIKNHISTYSENMPDSPMFYGYWFYNDVYVCAISTWKIYSAKSLQSLISRNCPPISLFFHERYQ